jgi:AraC-like DNA-binding protein
MCGTLRPSRRANNGVSKEVFGTGISSELAKSAGVLNLFATQIRALIGNGGLCMTSATGDFRSYRFSRVPVRVGDFRSDVAGVVRPFGLAWRVMSMLSEGSCHEDLAVQGMGRNGSGLGEFGVCVQRASVSSGVSIQRTRDLLCNDDVVLYIQEAGQRTVSQLGREATVGAGNGLLWSNADVSNVVMPEAVRFVHICVPRKVMLALAPGLEDAFVRPLPPNAGVLRLLSSYVDVLEDEDTTKTPELQRAVATHIHDLCALAIGATRDAVEIATGRGLRVARLRAVKADVIRNLRDGDVSVTALAARHHVTPRYIQRLFEGDDTTLSKFVLGQRLAQAHRMLADPGQGHRMIATLAFEVGFGDLSTFNREFRRHYGATPSDVRDAASNNLAR